MDFATFTVSLLLSAEHPPALTEAEADRLQDAHMSHLADLHESGALLAAGPVLGPPQRRLRGLSVLSRDLDEAADLVGQDPAVAAGVYRHELCRWTTPAGLVRFRPGRLPRSMAEALAAAPSPAAAATEQLHFDCYIGGGPEAVWEALVGPEQVPQWRFGMTFDTDWGPGSSLRTRSPDGSGHVRECRRPERLVYDWAADDPTTNAGLPSLVSFDVTGVGAATRLTARHEGLVEGEPFHRVVSGGWPMMLSSLKSLVETGRALQFS